MRWQSGCLFLDVDDDFAYYYIVHVSVIGGCHHQPLHIFKCEIKFHAGNTPGHSNSQCIVFALARVSIVCMCGQSLGGNQVRVRSNRVSLIHSTFPRNCGLKLEHFNRFHRIFAIHFSLYFLSCFSMINSLCATFLGFHLINIDRKETTTFQQGSFHMKQNRNVWLYAFTMTK